MRGFARTLLMAVILFMAAAVIGFFWLNHQYEQFLQTPLSIDEEGLELVVAEGSALKGIASDLANREVIKQPRYLEFYARSNDLAQRIKAGEYRIDAGARPADLIQQIVDGKVIHYSVTLIEGWNFRELMAAIKAHPQLEQTLTETDGAGVMKALGEPELHPEGLFYPDTYHITRGTSDLALLKRARARMKRYLEQAWQARDTKLPLKSPYEALILASIVEKETGVAEERPTIAGVFTRRLNKRMRLQTDPTVIYGMGESFDGDIRFRDLKQDTPYNTYTRRGLPPTPIAIPSGAAIDAALHPADGKSLYFVADGSGGHTFSATLEEHNRAVRKYQLRRK
ncbi:endolytic transglycosylase MltG [Candidatus Reidiella endopervernicosa]|nr:endolytic transglycosylase MltG [Solemya pervernicosa gill symbiont]QKQ26906.1 endolytic transglycosylase MltG [Candidatus Reidiella endopervernicosa]